MQYHGKIWKFGNNVNTDMIIAGEHLTSNDPAVLRKFCFAGADPEWARLVKEGDIVVAGKNFGCGSSREQAPIAIKAAGVSCIVAESFGAIFYRNAINVGLPLIELPNAAGELRESADAVVDMGGGTVSSEGNILKFEKPGKTVTGILNAGGLIPYIQAQSAGK
jgi:3-isopropylmalate/(R)-2-methylmalate dehydratase small subunit